MAPTIYINTRVSAPPSAIVLVAPHQILMVLHGNYPVRHHQVVGHLAVDRHHQVVGHLVVDHHRLVVDHHRLVADRQAPVVVVHRRHHLQHIIY